MANPDGASPPEEAGPDADQESQSRLVVLALVRTAGAALAVPVAVLLSTLVVGPWLAAVLLLAVLAVLWFWHGPAPSGRIPAAASGAVQLCVLVVVTVVAAREWGWLPAAGAALLAGGAVIAEQPLGRLAALKVPFVSNMPGLRRPPMAIGRFQLGRQVRLAALGVGVVATAAGLPAWTWLVAAAATMVHPVLVGVRTLVRLRAGRAVRRTLRSAVAAYAPEFVVYTSRPDAASYQILMWLPYLRRTGRRFVIVARTNTAASAVAAGTDDPVITCRAISELDDIIQPSLRAAFYVNASSGNGAFVRFKQLTHVYLGHGDSDKPPSYNPTHAMYDRIFAAGEGAIQRYADHGVAIDREKFVVVGRPQVEAVERPEPTDAPPRTVLYAPTWQGHVAETLLYSLPRGEQIVAALLDRGLTVIFRPHPFSYDFPEDRAVVERINDLLRSDAATTGRPHLFGAAAETELSITDCINRSDAMVSDVSSVVSDYLFSEKPFAMVAVPCPPDEFVAEYPIAEGAYVVRGDLADLPEVLDDLLGSDPRREQRRAIRERYLGSAPAEGYSDLFVRACVAVVDQPPDASHEAADDTMDDAVSAPLVTRLRGQFAAFGRDAAFAGVSLLAVLAMVAAIPGLAAVIAFGVIALIVVGGRRAVGARISLDRLLGTVVMARVVLAMSLWSLWVSTTGSVWPTGLGIGLLVLATATEVPLRVAALAPGTGIANLPQLGDPPQPRMPAGLVFVVNLGVLALGWLMVLLDGPGWLLLAAALAALAPLVVACRNGVARLARLEVARARLPLALEEYRPRFAVYFGSSIGADYQVGMWLPYFRRIGSPFFVVTRTTPMLRAVAELDSSVPVVFRPTLRSLEDVVVPGLTTAFYVNNAVRNTHFIERRELTHVWLNHGDSEKPACFNPVHAIYDRLFAAGQAGIDRYARHGVTIPREKFQIVGRPQVEQIVPARGPIASLSDVTVLYAPTWKGPYADSRVYSLPFGDRIVAELLRRGVRVIFRAHPFNERYWESRSAVNAIGKLLEADRKSTGRAHLWGPTAEQAMTVEECFNASDAMIADVSAVVSDYLKSQKPFSMVAVGQTTEQLLEVAPAARAAYVLQEDLSNLTQVCDDLLGADPLAGIRRETRVYYLGDFAEDSYADGFLRAAREVVDGSTRAFGEVLSATARDQLNDDQIRHQDGESAVGDKEMM